MALQRTINGEYVLKNKSQLKNALTLMQELSDDIVALMEKHGIQELQQDAVELKKAATRYMEENEIDEVQLDNGQYGKLVRGAYDRRWIFSDDELSEAEMAGGARSLRRILKKKFKKNTTAFNAAIRAVSKRVADPEKIQDAVSEGIITENEIAPAFVEKEKKPYLRVFGERDE